MQKSKEIIYFLPYIAGGVTSFVRNLLEFRPKSDIYYKVIFTRLKERMVDNFEINFNANEIIIFNFSEKENLFSVFRRLKKHISSDNSFLVANDGLELRMANALKLKNPLIYIVHGNFDYYFRLAQNNHNIIDKIISVSNYLSKKLSEFVLKNNKIFTEYAPVTKIDNFEKNIFKTKIIIVFVGFITKLKGVLLFDEICKKLLAKNIIFELNIIGDGDLFHKVKYQLIKHQNVKLIGQVQHNKVIEFLKKSDILLFPTYAEGMPVAVVEAMKCGCVPVVSDIPSGIPEIVFDGKTGFKIKIGDTDGFANAIEYLYKNPQDMLDMSLNCQKLANEMFDPYKQAEKYEKLILSTTIENKIFEKKSLGRILNKPYLPNFLVKTIRSIIKNPKL